MSGILNVLSVIFIVVATILTGVFAAFLVVLNYIKDEEERLENKNGKANK